MSIDWETINAKLPFDKEQKEERQNLWNCFDVNGNGYASLAEVQRGIRDCIQVDELFDAIPAINRSFHNAKNISKVESEHGPDYLERSEFRVFLLLLRQYFEYFEAFERIDEGSDRRISLEEFTDPKIKESIEKWVGPIEDMEAEFATIDENGGGQILFSEFVDWAAKKNLDLEDDVD